MGFLDSGETRSGQLGDTGIIVLEHCGPLLKVNLKGSALRFIPLSLQGLTHGRMYYKDTKPYTSAFLSVDLLTDFAAFCLTDFKDWRYIHSWFVFSTQLVNCCPHG